jgi:hypothetical protein
MQLIVPHDQKKQNAHDTREHSVMPCVNRKPVMLSIAVLVGCVALATVEHGQSLRSDRKEQGRSPDKPGMSPAPSASGGALRYRERDSAPSSAVPPRSPDLGSATFPHSPSIGPGSGLLRPESGPSPSGLRSTAEQERGRAGTGKERRSNASISR